MINIMFDLHIRDTTFLPENSLSIELKETAHSIHSYKLEDVTKYKKLIH